MSEREEYLTIKETASMLRLKPKTVKNKMAAGIFKKGIHYFSPKGLGPRFKWSAIVDWIEQTEEKHPINGKDLIPMARGYYLGSGTMSEKLQSPLDKEIV